MSDSLFYRELSFKSRNLVLSTSLKIALKTLQIENFKKHLMDTTTKEIKKFVSTNKIWN